MTGTLYEWTYMYIICMLWPTLGWAINALGAASNSICATFSPLWLITRDKNLFINYDFCCVFFVIFIGLCELSFVGSVWCEFRIFFLTAGGLKCFWFAHFSSLPKDHFCGSYTFSFFLYIFTVAHSHSLIHAQMIANAHI